MVINIATLSYAIAAAAFLLLSVLLATSWRGRMHGMALTAASTATAAWAGIVAWQAAGGYPVSMATDVLEILRNAGWTAFLLMVLAPHMRKRSLGRFRASVTMLAISGFYLFLLAATVYSFWVGGAPLYASAGIGFAGQIGLAVCGMLLVEQLYRNTPPRDRWTIKFACLGIGGLFAFDFYLYSDAMLFRNIDPEIWAARGLVEALAVPLLAVSAARNPKWSSNISVSRQLVFHSTALFGAALYLLAMAAGGYYLRYFGGSWGSVMQTVFLCGALLLLLGVLVSGTFRSRLRVFISKNFYSYRYDYREEWLRFTRILAEQGPDLGLRVIHAIAELVESPGGALWVRRAAGNYELAARTTLGEESPMFAADSALCCFMARTQWVIDLDELRAHPESYEGLDLPPALLALPRAWLVVPLMLQGALYGFVVLAKPRSGIVLNWEVTDLLKIAGTQAASHLGQQESANALMVARQFEAINRMSTFMVHDLKNLIFQLSLLLANAEKHRNNPAFQKDMQETLDHSVKKMKLLLHKLASGQATDDAEGAAPLAADELLRQAVALKSTSEPRPVLESATPGLSVVANKERLERVTGHLIQNAIEATPRDGLVAVRLEERDGYAVVEVSDSGCGMSEEFIRERLFKPFETTKSAGMGIGVFESREYIHELGGRLEVESRLGGGTTFRMVLPLHRDSAAAGAQSPQQQEENV
jgi:putative PEP-CTERM system histidine kinase